MTLITIRTLCRNSISLKQNLASRVHLQSIPKVFIRRLETNNKTDKPGSLVKRITKQVFGRYLLTTNIVGSGVLMVVGDVMAQEIEYRRGLAEKRCDFQRIARMFIVGALQGPLHHYFYRWMDAAMPVVSLRTVFKKIALDQIVMAPLCLVIFFYSAGFLEGKNITACGDELRSKFLTIYMVDWMVWPLAQFCNFYYLHPKYRVTYVNVVTALYNVFLSYIKHEDDFVKHEETLIPSNEHISKLDDLLKVSSVK